MIKEKIIINNLRNSKLKMTGRDSGSGIFISNKSLFSSKNVNSSKASLYKTECIEALQTGKVYKTTKEMLADVKNW